MAKKINCKWQEDQRLLVNPDGQVMPCCYLANLYYQCSLFAKQQKEDQLFEGHKAQFNHFLLQAYFKNEEDLNIFNNDVEDILNHEWFTKILPESWEKEETQHIQCSRMCGVDNE